jgi:rubrerythrin
MQSPDDSLETIDLIAAHEEALGKLYQAYADRLPEYAPLFRRLSEDETVHAAAAASFVAKARESGEQVSSGPLRAQAIRTSLTLVAQSTQEAQSAPVTGVAALSISHDFEEASIEKRFFEVAETDSAELRELMARLAEETLRHRELLREAWDKARHRG